MVADDEIRERLLYILQKADLTVMTERIARKQLEQDLGISLADRKPFIREEVGKFLQGRNKQTREEAEDGEEEVDGSDGGQKNKRKAKVLKAEKKKRGPGAGGGLTKLCRLSEKLAKLLGHSELPRTLVVKEMWNYIRNHDLQDPTNKRVINCDAALREVFGCDSTDMFQMNKLLSTHVFTLPNADGEMPVKKEKKPKVEGEQNARGSAFKRPEPITEALQRFLKTSETQMVRADVVCKMWMYIKDRGLQDPQDKRRIKCDRGMRELFGVEEFNGFVITKFLKNHIGREAVAAAVAPAAIEAKGGAGGGGIEGVGREEVEEVREGEVEEGDEDDDEEAEVEAEEDEELGKGEDKDGAEEVGKEEEEEVEEEDVEGGGEEEVEEVEELREVSTT